MKYTIKITKEIPTEEKYPRNEDVYEQVVDVIDYSPMFVSSSTTGEIKPLPRTRDSEELIKSVIKAVNQF